MTQARDLGPLKDGGRVAIVGGGPGGSSCAIALMRRSRRMGRGIEVFLFEPKEFGAHYNQCAGVLSPPLQETLSRELGVVLPKELLQRRIQGYTLYSERDAIFLPTEREGEATFAVRRVELDRFLLHSAEEAGVQVIRSRAYDLEFDPDGVTVYCDSKSLQADVLVGAFGLEPTMGEALSRRTGYQSPPCLETVVTKIHPAGLEPIPGLLEDIIHVFLPSLRPVEFGALVPKGNHITIIIAGRRVRVQEMQAFLQLPQVRKLLPERYEIKDYFKGTFPLGPARRSFGDRYVTVGDAAGLVRPFKGKGIYSAVLTGLRAAKTILEVGISREAFRHFYGECSELTRDVWYGRLVRILTLLLSKHLSFDPLIAMAKQDADVKQALYLAVSGHESYRNILLKYLRPKLVGSFLTSLGRHSLGLKGAEPRPLQGMAESEHPPHHFHGRT